MLPRYHEAVELVGKRWTGAIPTCCCTAASALHGDRQRGAGSSDRLLSERMKELEAAQDRRAPRQRRHADKVCYELTEKGRQLAPAMAKLKVWADRWLD